MLKDPDEGTENYIVMDAGDRMFAINVEQWIDILDVCNATSGMPVLLVRSLPFYQWAPGKSENWVANTTYGLSDPEPLTGNQMYNATCQARTIVFADLKAPAINFTTRLPCDVMSHFLNASTGDIWQMSKLHA